jgi:hypothetical protein
MVNFYRSFFEENDVVLLFLLPIYLVNEVIKLVIHLLHTKGKSVVFAFLNERHLFIKRGYIQRKSISSKYK